MVYVCFIIDVFSRTIVGRRITANMRTDMVLDALESAGLGATPEQIAPIRSRVKMAPTPDRDGEGELPVLPGRRAGRAGGSGDEGRVGFVGTGECAGEVGA